MRCPCASCNLLEWKKAVYVRLDLYQKGFMNGYTLWFQHGEELPVQQTYTIMQNEGVDEGNTYRDILIDVGRAEFDHDDHNSTEPDDMDKKFYDLLREADEPI
ncbi:hypothetical protein RJ639_011608 [Escallonia herrerae]|uniref:Transposase-associated domain-containing protein n=1 Tax=Escallonia herrerae TaxID=1293975 RepID=A0AA88VM89_9ASTE|nr:hypothetical protein RJ639_011608 [Escallonia herrerae]